MHSNHHIDCQGVRLSMEDLFHTIKTFLFSATLGLALATNNSPAHGAASPTTNSKAQREASGNGEILFEGYLQIFADSLPSGYVIQRYEHNHTTRELISKYYIQTSSRLGSRRESLVAKCTEDFQPLFYRYTDKGPHHHRVTEAHFKDHVMRGYMTTEGGVPTPFQKKVPQGVFLSTFLGYLMLNKGYLTGVKFVFSAISEEDAQIFQGQSYVQRRVRKRGVPAFKLLNEFKESPFTSFISPRGDILQAYSPLQRIGIQLTSFSSATKGFPMDEKEIKSLFGDIPKGLTHAYAHRRSPTQTSTPLPAQ